MPRTCAPAADPARSRRDPDPDRSRHRRRPARQPAVRQRRPERPADRRLRIPQPVPVRDRPRRRRSSIVANVGWNDYEEIDHLAPGSAASSTTPAGPASRASGPTPDLLEPRTSALRKPRRRAPAAPRRRSSPTRHDSPGRPPKTAAAPGRRVGAVGDHLLRGRLLSGRLRRRSLLRRLGPRLHLRDVPRRRRPPRSDHDHDDVQSSEAGLYPGRRHRRWAPGATSTT